MYNRQGLWLFDNDGTLSSSSEYHAGAWAIALKRVANEFGGDLDLKRVNDATLKKIGLSERAMAEKLIKEFRLPFPQSLEKTVDKFRGALNELIDSEPIMVFPGALEFLADLKKREQYTGIVTGNDSSYGKRVLDKTGLSRYLDVLAFADGLVSKPEIARRAVDIARGRGFNYEYIVSVGDNKVDIEGGKAVNAFTVGVLTGTHNEQQLKEAGADLVVSDLKSHQEIYDFLRGRV